MKGVEVDKGHVVKRVTDALTVTDLLSAVDAETISPSTIVSFLDKAAIDGPQDRHAWDYATNVEEVVVDHKARTITFKTKDES